MEELELIEYARFQFHNDQMFHARVHRAVEAIKYQSETVLGAPWPKEQNLVLEVACSVGLVMANIEPQNMEFIGPKVDEEDSPYIDSLHGDLRRILNLHSAENGANIPDNILATYVIECIKALNVATNRRDRFFNFEPFPKIMLNGPAEGDIDASVSSSE